MADASRPMIAGAGPVGLAAALFLARQGITTRVIDAATDRPTYSRALAVNPRTLALLESTGVTDQIISLGKRIVGGSFWLEGRTLAEVDFKDLHDRRPFMIALSQGVSERLLREALEAKGGHVERGVALANCISTTAGVDIETGPSPDQTTDKQTVPYLLAADGAHSVARRRLNIDFPGSTFETPWHLVDVPLNTTLADDRAHVAIFRDGGFLFLLRVVGDGPETGAPIWRVMGNFEEPLKRLFQATIAGPAVWSSSFRVAHRINKTLQVGNICFAGDAAHLHSPVGARGMNLGIEDAYVFAELVRRGELHRYGALRHAVDSQVVRQIKLISTLVVGESRWTRFVRSHLMPLLPKIPPIRRRLIANVTGLDHSLGV